MEDLVVITALNHSGSFEKNFFKTSAQFFLILTSRLVNNMYIIS